MDQSKIIIQLLQSIITQYGYPNESNLGMYRGLLHDLLVDYPRECNILKIPLEQGLIFRLSKEYPTTPYEILLPQMVSHLHTTFGMDTGAARWAIDTWAEALVLHLTRTCISDFSLTPNQGNAPMQVQCTNTSKSEITGYEWDSGDGSSLSRQRPEHEHTDEGTDSVTQLDSQDGFTGENEKPDLIEGKYVRKASNQQSDEISSGSIASNNNQGRIDNFDVRNPPTRIIQESERKISDLDIQGNSSLPVPSGNRVLISIRSVILIGIILSIILISVISLGFIGKQTDSNETSQTTATLKPLISSSISQIWQYRTKSSIDCTPIVDDGVVYTGSNDGYLYALNVKSGKLLWKYSIGVVGRNFYSSPAVADDVLYVGSNDGTLSALNSKSGEKIWTYKGDNMDSTPVIIDGIVYVGGDSHSLKGDLYVYAFDAKSGEVKWKYKDGSCGYTSPAVVDGVVYLGSHDCKDKKEGGHIIALNADSGTLLWREKIGADVYSSPTVVGGIVYIGSDDSYIYALSAKSGEIIWRYMTANSVKSSPIVVDNILYVGSTDRYVYALNAKSGDLMWKFETKGPISSSPAVFDGAVYVGSMDRFLYSLHAQSGDIIWKYSYPVSSSPVVSDGIVYVGCQNGVLYALSG